MKKRVVLFAVLLCMILMVLPDYSWAYESDTEENPVTIVNAETEDENGDAEAFSGNSEGQAEPGYTTEETGILEETNTDIHESSEIENELNDEKETEFIEIPDDIESNPAGEYSNQGVYKFIERLYIVTLDRQPDKAGIDDWYYQLIQKQKTGAEVAFGFIFSDEFLAKNLDDSQYLDVLYRAFFDREADRTGKQDWLNRLNNSVSRLAVFNGFANSTEYKELCSVYGIEAGTAVSTDICDANDDITMFVHRCYEKFLGRKPDKIGLNDWVGKLVNGTYSPQRIAYGFVFSQEFIDMNQDDTTFVTTLYRGLFNREPDAQGLETWTNALKSGKTRLDVFKGFAFSNEFRSMIQKFGLSMGNDSLSDIQDYSYLLNNVKAKAYLAYDENGGQVIYEKNAGQVMQLASQTKLMTALVVLDHVSDLNARVQMTDAANKGLVWETYRAGLVNGKYYTIRTLLEGMLVYSGADCANLLALYVGGTIDNFVQMMNDKALELGMTDTYFSDPVGLYDNHSTALQYIKLAVAARNNAVINEITAMPYCEITDVDGGSYRKLQNGNAMVAGYLSYDKNLYIVDGMKTGTTDQAGYCLTTSAYDSKGSRVITVVLNTVSNTQRGLDSKYLLDAVYGNNLKGYYSLATP